MKLPVTINLPTTLATLAACLLAAAALACSQPTPPPDQPQEYPTSTPANTPHPEPEPTTAPEQAPATTSTPEPEPTVSPTRDPSLYNTPTPDAYAQGHSPAPATDNQAFLTSIPQEEADCLRESLPPNLHQHAADLATSNSHPERNRLWNCLSETTTHRILVERLAPLATNVSPQAQACVAQMTARTGPLELWQAAHHQGNDPALNDMAANLAYAVSGCLSNEPSFQPTQIGNFHTSMAHDIECLRDQLGNPEKAALALRRGYGHAPAQTIKDSIESCTSAP